MNSDALIASGSDALFDAVITLATMISAGIMLLWQVSLDGILGALISVVIIKAGFEMLASPVNELLGARISPDLLKAIKKGAHPSREVNLCDLMQPEIIESSKNHNEIRIPQLPILRPMQKRLRQAPSDCNVRAWLGLVYLKFSAKV